MDLGKGPLHDHDHSTKSGREPYSAPLVAHAPLLTVVLFARSGHGTPAQDSHQLPAGGDRPRHIHNRGLSGMRDHCRRQRAGFHKGALHGRWPMTADRLEQSPRPFSLDRDVLQGIRQTPEPGLTPWR